jgi:hypothetical protein
MVGDMCYRNGNRTTAAVGNSQWLTAFISIGWTVNAHSFNLRGTRDNCANLMRRATSVLITKVMLMEYTDRRFCLNCETKNQLARRISF